MNDERILRLLTALAENDGASEAPPHIEAWLRTEFRRNRARRARRRTAMWSGAAAAMVVVTGFFVAHIDRNIALRERERSAGQAGAAVNSRVLPQASSPADGPTSKSSEAYAVSTPAKSSPARAAKPASAPRVTRRAVLAATSPSAAPPEAPAEMVTDFFPLLDPAPPFERGEILRVNLPASVMRTVGLPVWEERLGDRVQADLLVGEEGLPRAIRFVRTDTH